MNTFPILLVKIISNTTKQIQHINYISEIVPFWIGGKFQISIFGSIHYKMLRDAQLIALLQPTSRGWAKYFRWMFCHNSALYSNYGTSRGASVSTLWMESLHLPFIVEQVSSKVCWATGSTNSSAASHFFRSLFENGCSLASDCLSWTFAHGSAGAGASDSTSAAGLCSFRFWLSLRKISFFSLCKRKEWLIFALKQVNGCM